MKDRVKSDPELIFRVFYFDPAILFMRQKQSGRSTCFSCDESAATKANLFCSDKSEAANFYRQQIFLLINHPIQESIRWIAKVNE
jgi:hypothetical protein